MIGSVIQHYRVLQRIGAGGMGEVYLAEDLRLGRRVAMKFLSPRLRGQREYRARFLNEARAASLLRSRDAAVIYDVGDHDGSDFIVMEYVEGELLSQCIATGPLPLHEVLDIGLQVASALEQAHGLGITHRDIKSANLIRTSCGLVKVLDFGVAKFLRSQHDGNTVTHAAVSLPGVLVGTVSYMAPE